MAFEDYEHCATCHATITGAVFPGRRCLDCFEAEQKKSRETWGT